MLYALQRDVLGGKRRWRLGDWWKCDTCWKNKIDENVGKKAIVVACSGTSHLPLMLRSDAANDRIIDTHESSWIHGSLVAHSQREMGIGRVGVCAIPTARKANGVVAPEGSVRDGNDVLRISSQGTHHRECNLLSIVSSSRTAEHTVHVDDTELHR